MNPAPDAPWFVSADPALIDAEAVHRLLRGSYWAESRSLATVQASLRHSVCFGAYLREGTRQIGFARVVTDHATFSWICDVIVDERHRGQGVGKALMAAVMAHPSVQSTTNLLGTRDAHGLYERFGFVRREMLRRSGRAFG
ncbi:MAG TPA: GNAT family N-acetyltransferase [Opitutaceae bacterium]|nr:GNAT family N-acetyltransferase [Opitutaceae bacterium]